MKKKGVATEADWQAAWCQALTEREQGVIPDAFRLLLDVTLHEVATMVGDISQWSWAWSAGKDSIALHALLMMLDMEEMKGVCGIITPLEWPYMLQWTKDRAAAFPSMRVYERTDLDLPWLTTHQDWLFPQDSKINYRWTMAGTRWAQHRFIEDTGITQMIVGRRLADGNICGDDRGLLVTSTGTYYSPLRHWSNEDLLRLVAYSFLPVPELYAWPRGFSCGTGTWPSRKRLRGDFQANWQETYAIDKQVVRDAAAAGIETAVKFLRSL